MNVAEYHFEPLGDHDRSDFSCGQEPLDRYLREQASQDLKRKLAAVFVLVSRATPRKVAAYYTLSNREIRLAQIPPEIAKKAGRYDRLPVTLLGRMAVDSRYKGHRIGERTLLDALYRSYTASLQVASFAVFVEAIDKNAAAFYRKYGFIDLLDDVLRLFLPMKTIERLPGIRHR